jgi:hypothetical protein
MGATVCWQLRARFWGPQSAGSVDAALSLALGAIDRYSCPRVALRSVPTQDLEQRATVRGLFQLILWVDRNEITVCVLRGRVRHTADISAYAWLQPTPLSAAEGHITVHNAELCALCPSVPFVLLRVFIWLLFLSFVLVSVLLFCLAFNLYFLLLFILVPLSVVFFFPFFFLSYVSFLIGGLELLYLEWDSSAMSDITQLFTFLAFPPIRKRPSKCVCPANPEIEAF